MPLPGPDWIRPVYGELQPLQVQFVDPRLFTALGISSRQGYNPVLLPTVQPVVSLPLPTDDTGVQSELFADSVTAAGEAFHGGAVAGPVAAQVSFVQLFNPASSGKVAYIDVIEYANLTATSRFELRSGAAALGAAATAHNKNNASGAPAAVMQLRQGSSAAPGGTVVRQEVALVNEKVRTSFSPPFRLAPGNGLFIVGFTVNQVVLGNIEWREKVAS